MKNDCSNPNIGVLSCNFESILLSGCTLVVYMAKSGTEQCLVPTICIKSKGKNVVWIFWCGVSEGVNACIRLDSVQPSQQC